MSSSGFNSSAEAVTTVPEAPAPQVADDIALKTSRSARPVADVDDIAIDVFSQAYSVSQNTDHSEKTFDVAFSLLSRSTNPSPLTATMIPSVTPSASPSVTPSATAASATPSKPTALNLSGSTSALASDSSRARTQTFSAARGQLDLDCQELKDVFSAYVDSLTRNAHGSKMLSVDSRAQTKVLNRRATSMAKVVIQMVQAEQSSLTVRYSGPDDRDDQVCGTAVPRFDFGKVLDECHKSGLRYHSKSQQHHDRILQNAGSFLSEVGGASRSSMAASLSKGVPAVQASNMLKVPRTTIQRGNAELALSRVDPRHQTPAITSHRRPNFSGNSSNEVTVTEALMHIEFIHKEHPSHSGDHARIIWIDGTRYLCALSFPKSVLLCMCTCVCVCVCVCACVLVCVHVVLYIYIYI